MVNVLGGKDLGITDLYGVGQPLGLAFEQAYNEYYKELGQPKEPFTGIVHLNHDLTKPTVIGCPITHKPHGQGSIRGGEVMEGLYEATQNSDKITNIDYEKE